MKTFPLKLGSSKPKSQPDQLTPLEPEKDSSHSNELELALQMRQRHGLFYDRQLKSFELYNPLSGLWELQTEHQIKAHVFNHLVQVHKVNKTLIAPLTATKMVNAICTVLKYSLPEPANLDTKNLVAVQNGVLDFGNYPDAQVELLDHSPDYYLTNGSPVTYEPKASCSEFIRVLLAKAFDSDDMKLIQRYFGSVLLGSNETQGILIIKGSAGIGKSTLVAIMESVIGLANVADLRTQHLAGRFEMSSFISKKLLVGKDVSQDFLSVAGARVLKSLVGGDFLQVERKSNNQRIDIHGNYHVVITCNSDIRVPAEQDSDAWQRRLLVVNSSEPRPKRVIPNLAETLLSKESSGILNWLIEGAKAHRNELAQFGQYQLTDRQRYEIQKMIHIPGQVKAID